MRPLVPKFYGFVIPFRAQHPALLRGNTVWLHNSNEQQVVTYLRRSAEEEVLVAVNLSNAPFRGTVEAMPGTWTEAPNPIFPDRHIALPFLSLDAFEFRFFTKPLLTQSSTTPSQP